MTLGDLNKNKYVALETYKKNGQGVSTAMWVTAEADRLYMLTDANSWKAKRIRKNSRVRLAQSDSRGNVEGVWVEGEARIIDDPETIKAQKRRAMSKYGLMVRLMSLVVLLTERQRVDVVIEIQ